jgi:outer membrane protein insertion porin family
VRPALQVTAPTAWSTTAFWRADVSANGYLPLGRPAVLSTRVSAGRLFPFGKSLPGPGEDPLVKFLQLHDFLFTAGGSGETRGWENRLLGPKVPNILFDTVADSTVPRVEGYVPVGGFGRVSFSVELQLPLPGFGSQFRSHFFLDGGRVWTDDERYQRGGDPYGQERMFYATGGGLSMLTPVGPIKVSVGYKLNPSVTDLVDAADIQRAGDQGQSIDDLPRDDSRRWQWHLAIGSTF